MGILAVAQYLTTRLWEFYQFCNQMQLGTEMNWLDFEIEG